MRRDLQNIALCATAVFSATDALANPSGLTVVSGSATAVASGSTLNITASQNAVLNWQTFNIAANETVNFKQPSATSVVWDRILDSNPSQILGNINANGYVVLMNQNGFYFGQNSVVNVGGFVAAGAWVTPPATGGGAMWTYQGPPPTASIINYGEIKANDGGSLFLVAEKIENHGVLTAPDGTLGLYAGKQVMVSERPDGRGLSAAVTLPNGSVDNEGKIIADAGTIALQAQVVNQDGLIQANSVQNNNGVIELVAGGSVDLGANSVIQANGDSSGASDGGTVTIKSSGSYADDPASQIQVQGGANGGNGGAVEISAAQMTGVNSQLNGSAQPGCRGGSLLLDPYDIELSDLGVGNSSGSVNPDGSVNVGDEPGSVLQLNVDQDGDFKNFSQITLQAQNSIWLDDGLTWNLNASTGIGVGMLTLEAGNNINFGLNNGVVDDSGTASNPLNGAQIVSGGTTTSGKPIANTGWTVNLMAGVDFSTPTPTVQSGVGGIYNAQVESLAGGAITLDAGHEVQLGGGFLRTFNGGDITVTTGDGDVNTGQPASSGTFFNTYSSSDTKIDKLLGGIVTQNGGDVIIDAGGNIVSPLTSIATLGAGNVNLAAGGDISGNFYVFNGTGTLLAGGDVGNLQNGANFGVTSGGWNVSAPNGNIYVGVIYNFNGTLGASHLFDYAPSAYADLSAGNSVQLLGNSALTSVTGDIYTPLLTINAGMGGVGLGDDITLFPSAQGSLDITTTGGGSLFSLANGFYNLVESDGVGSQYTTFSEGHAATPVHLGETGDAMTLSISGDLDDIYLVSPGAADINVQGSTENFSFSGQNLAATETTQIAIGGNYTVRGNVTTVTLADAAFEADYRQYLSIFQGLTSTDPRLGGSLYYDPTTQQLEFNGPMTLTEENELLNPQVYQTGANGTVALNAPAVPANFTVDAVDTAAIKQLYAATQDLPIPSDANNGLVIRGPGLFQISAANMDLGSSVGIESLGAYEPPLQALGSVMVQGDTVLPGADIQLTLGGDLTMVSSKIVSTSGGSISIQSEGSIDVGQENAPFLDDSTPRGIYTSNGGNVTLEAFGDIDVDGSRVAAYDGGNVNVISGVPMVNGQPVSWADVTIGPDGVLYELDPNGAVVYNKTVEKNGTLAFDNNPNDAKNGVAPVTDPVTHQPIRGDVVSLSGGAIDAGDGAKGFFYLNSYTVLAFKLDGNGNVIPGSIQVEYPASPPDFGSGILALTSVGSDVLVGNVTVAAGGAITAGTGGILQLAFNGTSQSGSALNVESFQGNIDTGSSGVLGQNVNAVAFQGDVKGIFVASGNANISAGQNISVTAFAGGSASVSGGGTVTGTVIGGGDVDVSGGDVTATAISTGGNVSGSGSGGNGAFAGVAAPTAQKTSDDAGQQLSSDQDNSSSDDDLKKKRGDKSPVLAQKVSRVTVILPKKT